MMADSFSDCMEKLVTQINGHAPLAQFCAGTWGRDLTVRTALKKRHEVHQNKLPAIMITRPSVTGHEYRGGSHKAIHGVRVYAGFYQSDADKAVLEQIRFEELICDAVLGDGVFTDSASSVSIGMSANDEGIGHPSYFTVIDFNVAYDRELTDETPLDAFKTLDSGIDMNPADGQIDAQDNLIMEQ
jgi:hypothetical protein